MCIARRIAVAVIDLDEITVALARSGPGHDTGRHREYVAAGVGREVHAFMHGLLTIEGIHALAEIG